MSQYKANIHQYMYVKVHVTHIMLHVVATLTLYGHKSFLLHLQL